MQALLKETGKLQGRDTWDLTSVREWSEVAKEAKQSGKQAHVGRIFPIVVQRNSELPDGHPENVCQVKDENNEVAIFEELSSSPAGMDVSKSVDAYGL